MAQFISDIEDLKRELSESNQLVNFYEKQQSEFKSVGPLKNHIDKLTNLLHEKESELAISKIDREEFRLKLLEQ